MAENTLCRTEGQSYFGVFCSTLAVKSGIKTLKSKSNLSIAQTQRGIYKGSKEIFQVLFGRGKGLFIYDSTSLSSLDDTDDVSNS